MMDLIFLDEEHYDEEHCALDERCQKISMSIEERDFLDRVQGFCFPSIAALRVLGAREIKKR